MLITINLLPTTKKNEHQTKKVNSKIFTLCFAIVCIIAGASFLLYTYSAALKLQANSTDADLDAQTKKTKTYAKTEESLKKITNTITYIDTLDKASLNYDEFLQKFSNIIPEKVQISSINITTLPDKNLDITGKAATRRDAILFLEKMKTTPFLKDPTLKTLDKAGETNSSSFTVSYSAKIITEKK